MGNEGSSRKEWFWFLILLVVAGCGGGDTVKVAGLRPEYPEVRYRFSDWNVAPVEIDSLHPTLRWESFPRPQDRQADKEGIMGRIRNVTYDLKIWRDDNDYPVELIYTRQGLPEPSHKLESSLAACTQYFWTVRARFELKGHTRVLEWGVTPPTPQGMQQARIPPEAARRARLTEPIDFARRLPQVPNPFSYRFKTPC